MKKAALLALFPLLLSTTAHAQNAVALCNLYQMRGSSPNDVIRIPAPPQLAGANGGLVEIHKDGKVTANGQDITAATTSLCASNPQAGAEEAGMKGSQAAASPDAPVKHTAHHSHKAPKTSASADTTSSGNNDITAPATAPSTSGTLGQLPANNTSAAQPTAAPGMIPASPAATTAPSSTSPNTGASMPAQTVPTAPPGTMAAPPAGTPSPSPDQHQEKPKVPGQ